MTLLSTCQMDLKINCLLCREPVTNFPNTGLHMPWIEEMTMSICEILRLDRTFQPLLEMAVYCNSCHFILRDLSFILKSVNTLQRRLEVYRHRVITLLGNNFDEFGDRIAGDDVDDSYEGLIKSIWASLSADRKPFFTESCVNDSEEASETKSRVNRRSKVPVRTQQPDVTSVSDFEQDNSPRDEADMDSDESTHVTRKRSQAALSNLKRNSSKRRRIEANQETSKGHRDSVSFRCGCGDAFTSRISLKQHRGGTCPITHPETIKTENESEEGFEKKDVKGLDNGNITRKRSGAKTGRLKSKISRRSGVKKFSCEECTFITRSEPQFRVHIRIHEGDETPYHCDLCNEAKFAVQGALYDHKRRNCPRNTTVGTRKNTIKRQSKPEPGRRSRFRLESGTDESESGDESSVQDTKEYICVTEGCDFSTKSKKRWQCHYRAHEGDPLPYWCSSCEMKFPKAKHLNLHKHRNCGTVLPCPIPNCQSVFPNKWTVKVHLTTSHYNYEKHTCQQCSKTFELNEEEDYQTHLQAHDVRVSEQQKFSCVVGNCSSTFTNSIDLKAHVLQEHETSSSKCDICQALLANPISLKRHMIQLHGPPKSSLQCDQCPYFAKSRAGLVLHKNRHSQTFSYICEVEGCGKGFNWPSGLRTHKLSHTGIKKYKCSFESCTKGFVTRGKLRDHEETHNSRHFYFCDRCTKTFKAKKNLEQHIRYMHKANEDDEQRKKIKQKRKPAGKGASNKSSRPNKAQTKNQKNSEVSQPAAAATANENTEAAVTLDPLAQIPIAEDVHDTPVDVSLGTGTWTLTQQYVGIGIGNRQQFLNPLILPENNTTLFFTD